MFNNNFSKIMGVLVIFGFHGVVQPFSARVGRSIKNAQPAIERFTARPVNVGAILTTATVCGAGTGSYSLYQAYEEKKRSEASSKFWEEIASEHEKEESKRQEFKAYIDSACSTLDNTSRGNLVIITKSVRFDIGDRELPAYADWKESPEI